MPDESEYATYRHDDCGETAQVHEFATGEKYFVCSRCLCSVDKDSVTEVTDE